MKRSLWKSVIVVVCIACSVKAWMEPFETTVFNGSELNGGCYRIPSIVRTTDGTLLAFAERRNGDCGDEGDIDIVCRRSLDDGETWGLDGTKVIYGNNDNNSYNAPTPVVDYDTGAVFVFFCKNSNQVYYKSSWSNGQNWSSTPYDITSSVTYAEESETDDSIDHGLVGPGHGIQLQRGNYAGRLVVPYHYITIGGRFKIRLIYSDSGQPGTWYCSSSNTSGGYGKIWGSSNLYRITETSVAELTNGDIYFNMRNDRNINPDHRYRIIAQTSDFLYTNPTTTLAFDYELPDPRVHGSVLRMYAQDQGDNQNMILFANPATATDGHRRYLTIRHSTNETGNWSERKLLTARRAAYSDMVKTDDGDAGILYETPGYFEEVEDGSLYKEIIFCKVDPDWITSGTIAYWDFEEKSSGYTTDVPKIINGICTDGFDGEITGRMKYVAGPLAGDTALEFGTTTAGYDPYSTDYITIDDSFTNNRLDVDSNEHFELHAVIKTTAHDSGGYSGAGGIIAKDYGPGEPSWWLRVQDGYVRFFINDDLGNSSTVVSTQKVNTGSWCHIQAVRNVSLDRLEIWINDSLRGTASDTTTSGFRNDEDVTIGNFTNASRQFIGKIGFVEVRAYR